ncbi:alpha/beta fold hydrolase [Neogemmobacter tilapiae]|uniref:alpha/beta fold hydrolase n=1 Tax=Neogemmobacter tilapiae TaxID=875041 RepID=UPI001674A853|nr:alpha/beta fold hydrolase [Gemmobacter tilapiae]
MGGAAQDSLPDALAALDAQPCVDSDLICVTLPMPLDHAANDPDSTVPVTFAVHMAPDPQGTLIYAVGGPGVSGLVSAGSYMPTFTPELTDQMNIIFFDQRGVGAETGLECLKAQAAFDRAPLPVEAPAQSIALARAFVQACKAEVARPDLLPYLTTDQVIRDLEAFRQKLRLGMVWIYGESYGTQVAQAYATAYPKAVKGIILDGVVDLNLSSQGFYATSTRAAEAILDRVFAECDADPNCAKDMGQPAAQAYDALMARLPMQIAYPLSSEGHVERALTPQALQNVAFYALYGQESRSELLRALAAAGDGDLVPLLRLEYANLYLDPDTETPLSDGMWFGAAYYAVTCGDYAEGSGDPTADAQAVIEQAKAWPKGRMDRSYYAERLACAFWSPEKGVKRPEPFAGGDYPTVVLNGDADPITPAEMAKSVARHARNSHLILQQNGPHVIWGRGESCPDDAVASLLFDGVRPRLEPFCNVPLMTDYLPLYPAGNNDPMSIASLIWDELWMYPDFYAWDGVSVIRTACTGGGNVTFSGTDSMTVLRFENCRIWPGVVLNGIGHEVYASDGKDGLNLTLHIAAGSDSGDVEFFDPLNGDAPTLSGTWNGQPL